MIYRSYSVDDIDKINFVPSSWLDDNNIALTDGVGNFSLYTYEYPGMYHGHFFFTKECRGRSAMELSLSMLDYAFFSCSVEVIQGLPPMQRIGARWMARQIGFKSYGIIYTLQGPCEEFILTKPEWIELKRNKNG